MRHFPAVNWLLSYSLYRPTVAPWMAAEAAPDATALGQEAMELLEVESELLEIARLVGVESLSPKERLVLETARSIREDFLHQNAYHPQDTWTSLRKQAAMLRAILRFHKAGLAALEAGRGLREVLALPVRERLAAMKYLPEDPAALDAAAAAVDAAFAAPAAAEGERG